MACLSCSLYIELKQLNCIFVVQRATQTVESYMAVPAGPLPWQSDADLNKEKEKKKGA